MVGGEEADADVVLEEGVDAVEGAPRLAARDGDGTVADDEAQILGAEAFGPEAGGAFPHGGAEADEEVAVLPVRLGGDGEPCAHGFREEPLQLLVGDQGFILGNRLYPEARRKEVGDVPATLPRSAGHYREWIEAAKGGKPSGSNFDWAGPLAEVVLLGNVALRVGLREKLTRSRLLWDPVAFKITNIPEANEYLHRPYREGWSL
jgi:hypothetical protein